VLKAYDLYMRTTLDLPADLLESARRAMELRTKRETVIAGLEELIRKGKREQLRGLAGKIRIRTDLARARRRRSA
jgi:Arc/MetJ family transcription regulator